MADAIAHRGTDGAGFFVSGGAALGQRWFSVSSHERAPRQPFVSSDRIYVTVLDGIILNYDELRVELTDGGVSFQTDSCEELITEMYRKHGHECTNLFNGAWAFVLFNTQTRQFFMSRDRFGIKPFYYLMTDEVFVFASEIKAILKVHPEQRKANEPYVKRFLISGLLDYNEETFFCDIKQFPAAHNAVWDTTQRAISPVRYWEVDEEEFRQRRVRGNDPADAFEQLMKSAIELHTGNEPHIGCCLSGGIDSSLITALFDETTDSPVPTFSGLYPDKGYDESMYTDYVNKNLKTLPVFVETEPKSDLVNLLKQITWHQDEPSAGAGLITQFAVMRTASRHVKVILDGQGADELFCGYISFIPTYIAELLKSGNPRNFFRAVRLTFNLFLHWGKEYIPLSLKQIRLRGWGFFKSRYLKRQTTGLALPDSDFTDSFNARTGDVSLVRTPKALKNNTNNLCYVQTTMQSVPALLHYEDRNSAAFSVDVRIPMLDYRIAEFALGLPPEYKIRNACWTKWVLRKALAKRGLNKIAWRRGKLGYPTPLCRWLREGGSEEALGQVIGQFKQRGIIKPDIIENLYKRHMSGKTDNSRLLYRYITLEIWYQIFIDDFIPHYATGGDTA
jgi:asparagine synthase (glutamine-hydrolysing)